MAKPSDRAPIIEQLLEQTFGRSSAIRGDRCIAPPIGCGQPATHFKDALSRKEFTISGLCQSCQDMIFELDPAERKDFEDNRGD